MNDKVAIIFVLVGIVLWLFIGIIIVKRKIRKILLSINFNFNCVCDKCGEKFVRQTEYIQKNFFEKAKRKTSSYRSENDIVITPVYEKYAREIECPNCKEKGFVRIENLDDWNYRIQPLSKNPFGIYITILLLSTAVFGYFLIQIYEYIY